MPRTKKPGPSERQRGQRFWLEREPSRVMYPDEFSRILRDYRHPRFAASGVARSRWGDNPRGEVAMKPAGSVWFAGVTGEREVPFSITANEIPYLTHQPDLNEWDEEFGRFKTDNQILRGWRSALNALVSEGFLRNHHALSRLVGTDTTYTIERKFLIQ